MTFRTLIRHSLRFHWRAHLGVVLGATVGSAALIGALVVGDSVRESLQLQAQQRLGWVDAAMAPADRFFTQKLDEHLAPAGWLFGGANGVAPTRGHSAVALKLPGTAARQDGTARANHVNVLGVDADFWSSATAEWKQKSQAQRIWKTYEEAPTHVLPKAEPNENSLTPALNHRLDMRFAGTSNTVILNVALAIQLNAKPGDEIILRVHKPTALSRDVPISPHSDSSIALRLKVCRIVPASELGDFSLQASQTPPLNAFVRLSELDAAAGIEGRANLLLAGDFRLERDPSEPTSRSPLWWQTWKWRIQNLFRRSVSAVDRLAVASPARTTAYCNARLRETCTLADFELALRDLPDLGMVELQSSRIFLDPPVIKAVLATTNREFLFPENAKVSDAATGFEVDPATGRTLDPATGLPRPLPSAASVIRAWREAATNQFPLLTYLVNQIRAGTNATPYSMVTAAGPPWTPADLRDDEIVVNQWLADDLRLKSGDSLEVSYFLPESGTRLLEATNHFRVRAVVPITGLYADRTLMPEFPGITKAESTHDWDAGFPLVHKIRDQDEAYWKKYRGTPKAFVTLAAGQKMWGSRFGDLTAFRFPVPTNEVVISYSSVTNGQSREVFASGGDWEFIRSVFERNLLANLKPADLGLRFEPVREQALKAASQGQDFGQLFLGFSFFLIVAALILMALLFQFGIEQRVTEIGTLLALGFTPKQVRWLFLREGIVLAALGGVLGAAGGLAYAWAMIRGLTTIWSSAVNAAALSFHVTTGTLIIGFVASVLVSALTIWLTLRKQARQPARELLAGEVTSMSARGGQSGHILSSWRILASRLTNARAICIGSLVVAIGLLGWTVARGDTGNAGVFFGAGALLLISGLAFTAGLLGRLNEREGHRRFTLGSLGFRGATRRRNRSLAVVGLLACGSFLIVAIGAFKLEAGANDWKRSSGTGGFALIGESTLPVVRDLNTTEGREFYGFDERDLAGVSIVPMRVRDGDEASCLNLNRAQKPRLLGVNPALLAERGAFTFAKTAGGLSTVTNQWQLLQSSAQPQLSPGEVPAIGDLNSILWAMGKKVGDTIDYTDERGQAFKIRLVGAVANSILQGNLLIDETEFKRRFPGESGYRMFLVDTPSNRVAEVSATVSRALQDVGLELTPAPVRLAQFNAVQNTYLNTFQVLGGLGLLLGSAGLGVVVLRNVLERRGELALLTAVGFRRRVLRRLVLSEHGGLLGLGLGVGIVSAWVAVMPTLLSPGSEIGYLSLGLTLLGVLASGLLWTWLATALAVRGKLLDALRSE